MNTRPLTATPAAKPFITDRRIRIGVPSLLIGLLYVCSSIIPAATATAAENISKNPKSQATPAAPAPVVVDAAYLAKAAARIDALVNDHLKKQNLKPNAKAADAVYLRRVYVTLAGRIPTQHEALEFLNDKSPNRQSRLVDKLLTSNGYKSSMFNWYADLFRVTKALKGSLISEGGFFMQFLRDSLNSNKPWDQLVFEMMAAEGSYAENGAIGLLLKDAGMPLDSMTNTMTLFLGADISCAQCHDHPLNDWKQSDFYKMAAFFGTTDVNGIRMVQFKSYNEKLPQHALSSNLHHALPKVDKNDWLTYPDDYAYKDAKPGEVVKPAFLMWDKKSTPAYVPVNYKDQDSLRVQFATWLTHPQNPRFAATISNRMWKRVFGIGVREQVTDLDDLTSASNPALLAYLAEEMVRLKFDLRAFQGLLVSTELFQREAEARTDQTAPFHFPGPLLRRMTSEQIFDSLMTTYVGDLIDHDGLRDETARLKSLTIAQGKTYVVCEDINENKPGIVKYDKAAMGALVERLIKELPKDAGSKDFGKGAKDVSDAKNGPNFPHGSARASEMKQPQDENHLIRYLGQSSRNAPDDGSLEGGIAQALNLMNGDLMNKFLCSPDRSFAVKQAQAAGGTEAQVRSLYVSLLTRHPTPAQLQQITTAMSQGVKLSEVAWAIFNGREFIFLQ
jgi:Protein of unknown function (DUF1549)/Protein of unknown function (DUF1553)